MIVKDGRERVLRANRTLGAVLDAEEGVSSEAEAVARVCQIAVDEAGYRMAWVGYVDAPDTRVRPVAFAGCEEGYLASLNVTVGDGPTGHGPTGTAIRGGAIDVAQNILTEARFAPWREQALKRGYASSAALPLSDGIVAFGALSLYAEEPDAFDPDEIELLGRLGRALSHQILCARGRVRLGRMEHELQRLDRLEMAGRIAATVAHDVNNCLAAVLPLIEEPTLDAAATADAKQAIARAIALNRDLLRLARSPGEVAVAAALDASIETLTSTLRRLAAPATLSFAPDAAEWRVRLDTDRIGQILTNLVINARDAMPSGGEVRVSTTKLTLRHPLGPPYLGVTPGEYVALRVSDTGEGIAPEVLERLFEPFFTTKGAAGNGLGLASVFSLVRGAGGHVFVKSTPGAGATFEALLPRVAPV